MSATDIDQLNGGVQSNRSARVLFQGDVFKHFSLSPRKTQRFRDETMRARDNFMNSVNSISGTFYKTQITCVRGQSDLRAANDETSAKQSCVHQN